MNPPQRQASDTSGSFDIDEILGVFANWEEIMRCARHHNATVKEKLYALACPHLADREQLVSWLLGSEETHPEVISAIANDPAPEIRALLAAYEETPAKHLNAFVNDPSETVRIHLASNPATPPLALTSLTHDSSLNVVLAAASAQHLEPSEVERLTQHRLSAVRTVIAQRRDLWPALTHRLATDRSKRVVAALLQAATTDPQILNTIVTIPDQKLRHSLITHPAASSVVIAGFFADPEHNLRDLARSRNMAFTRAPWPLHPSNSSAVPTRGTAPTGDRNNHQSLTLTAIYWMLDADYPSPSVFNAATNPEMPLQLRLAILARRDVPTSIIETCINDHDPRISTAATNR
jgi:hypothetical protein